MAYSSPQNPGCALKQKVHAGRLRYCTWGAGGATVQPLSSIEADIPPLPPPPRLSLPDRCDWLRTKQSPHYVTFSAVFRVFSEAEKPRKYASCAGRATQCKWTGGDFSCTLYSYYNSMLASHPELRHHQCAYFLGLVSLPLSLFMRNTVLFGPIKRLHFERTRLTPLLIGRAAGWLLQLSHFDNKHGGLHVRYEFTNCK